MGCRVRMAERCAGGRRKPAGAWAPTAGQGRRSGSGRNTVSAPETVLRGQETRFRGL